MLIRYAKNITPGHEVVEMVWRQRDVAAQDERKMPKLFFPCKVSGRQVDRFEKYITNKGRDKIDSINTEQTNSWIP